MKNSLIKVVAAMLATTSSMATANVNFSQTYIYDEYGEVKYLKFDGKYITYEYDLAASHSRVKYNGHEMFEVTDYDNLTGAALSYSVGTVAHSSTVGQSVTYDDAQFQVDLGFDQLGHMQVESLSDSFSNNLPVMMHYGVKTDARGFITKANKDVANDNALAKRQQFEYSYTTQGQLANYQWRGSDLYHSVNDVPSYNQSQSLAYEYDDRGNLERKVGGGMIGEAQALQTYNEKNQPALAGYVYDDKGRLKEDPDYIYRYNQLDRLALVIDKSNGLWAAHYLYDANGNRVRKVTQSTSIYFDRDAAGNLLHEKHYDVKTKALVKTIDYVNANGMNIAAVHYVADEGDATQMVQQKIVYQYSGGLQGTGQVNWTSLPIDSQLAASGVEQNEYSPFGQPLGDTDSQAYGYTGHEYDKETDSHYMKARYYDYDYGRFKSADPARDTDLFNPKSFNLYSYVGNNPINSTDPSGMLGIYNQDLNSEQSSAGKGGTNSSESVLMDNIKAPSRVDRDTVLTMKDGDGNTLYFVNGFWQKNKPFRINPACYFSESCSHFRSIDDNYDGEALEASLESTMNNYLGEVFDNQFSNKAFELKTEVDANGSWNYSNKDDIEFAVEVVLYRMGVEAEVTLTDKLDQMLSADDASLSVGYGPVSFGLSKFSVYGDNGLSIRTSGIHPHTYKRTLTGSYRLFIVNGLRGIGVIKPGLMGPQKIKYSSNSSGTYVTWNKALEAVARDFKR